MTASGATGPLGTRGTNLSIEMCLHVIIEDYVLGDLDTMTTEIRWKEKGAVCYPMVMAVLAGSELLGVLAGAPNGRAVEHYWTEYMRRVEPLYAELGALAQDLLRNGLMHTYFTKPGVGVVRDLADIHLTVDETGMLLLDCGTLARDFRESYRQHAKEAIYADRQTAEAGLARLTREATGPRSAHILAKIRWELFPPTQPTANVARISGIYVPAGASQYPG